MVGKHPKDVFSSIITEYEGQCTTKPCKNTETWSISEQQQTQIYGQTKAMLNYIHHDQQAHYILSYK